MARGREFQTPQNLIAQSAEDVFFAIEGARRIKTIFEGLSPGEQRVLTLRRLEGVSRQETARILGVEREYVTIKTRRALSTLRGRLHEEGFDVGGREIREDRSEIP